MKSFNSPLTRYYKCSIPFHRLILKDFAELSFIDSLVSEDGDEDRDKRCFPPECIIIGICWYGFRFEQQRPRHCLNLHPRPAAPRRPGKFFNVAIQRPIGKKKLTKKKYLKPLNKNGKVPPRPSPPHAKKRAKRVDSPQTAMTD